MSKLKSKRHEQLGMNPATASGRLVKDLLFKMILDTGQNRCHYCDAEMTRETFNITHKDKWLDSKDPLGLYFDLDNVTFAHAICVNRNADRCIPTCGTASKYRSGCRCGDCTDASTDSKRVYYTAEKRRERYERTGY